MPLSPFFLNGSPSEQRLVQDLVNEHLQLFGQDILYLPRKIINQNTVIEKYTASKFDDSFRLEAYLVNVQMDLEHLQMYSLSLVSENKMKLL